MTPVRTRSARGKENAGGAQGTVAGIAALVLLAGLAVLAGWSVQPPSPAGPDAPAGDFSAARAYAHVERIGQQVHPAGSDAAATVRDYLMSTLRADGLDVREQEDTALVSGALGDQLAMAHVHDVVAVLHGSDPTGRVFAVAHYDSVQVSYGANDDGAGVSSLLETARALTAGPKPRNDIVFVLTDAEEACLCGAEAFVAHNPLAADGGVVLNFESRGANGPSIMFETSDDNSGVVGVYGDSVPYPVATSFAVEVYRILPNDTDFTEFRESGRFTGLNSAYIDGSPVYHSPEDRPSYMDRGSLQMTGANALALVRAFGAADIATLARPSSGDSTYFPALGFLVRYPGWLVWPFAVLALLAVVALAVAARRRFDIGYGRLTAGFALALIPLLVAPVLAQLLWSLLVAIRPGYANLIDPWQPGWYRAGVLALVAATILTWYGLFRRRFGVWPLAVGALGWLAVLGLVLAAATPGGSYLAALPALAGALAALGFIAFDRRSEAVKPGAAGPGWAPVGALALGSAAAVIVLVPTVLLFFPALGLETGAAAALFATMLGLVLVPLLEPLFPATAAAAADPPDAAVAAGAPASAPRWRRALPGLVAAGLTVAFVGTGLAVDRFDAAHPAPAQLMYALDLDTDQARWVSSDVSPGPWVSGYVTSTAYLGDEFPPLGSATLHWGPAQVAALAPATVEANPPAVDGTRRVYTLTIRPQRKVRLVYVSLPGTHALSATVDGRAVPADDLAGDFGVLFHAPPPGGLAITVEVDAPGPLKVRVMDGSDGLDGLPGFTPRPPGVGVRGSHSSELVLVAKTYTM